MPNKVLLIKPYSAYEREATPPDAPRGGVTTKIGHQTRRRCLDRRQQSGEHARQRGDLADQFLQGF